MCHWQKQKEKICLQVGICKLHYWPDCCVAEVIIIRNITLKMLPLLKKNSRKGVSRKCELNPNPAKAKCLPLFPFYFDLYLDASLVSPRCSQTYTCRSETSVGWDLNLL